jgi:hypothetical protein
MPPLSEDEEFEFSIAFALSQFGYQSPRTRNTDERERYYRAVAKAVRKQLLFTWEFTRKPMPKIAQSSWKPPQPDGDES